jgi:glycosyltransferase involved in cell wall biosynthesis
MKNYIILIPIFNDWKSAFKLIENIDDIVKDKKDKFSILLINDGSTEETSSLISYVNNINSIKILNLIKNGGHGQAIATGLKYINDNINFDYAIPMDGDGEDRPEEILEFIKLINDSSPEVITAVRIKRSESLVFKVCYQIHKIVTLLLSGHLVKFGNYSCLSKKSVEQLVSSGSIWLSYSGAVTKNFPSFLSIPSIRGVRYFGPSKMNFFNLVKHSLKISAVFKESVFIRSALLVLLLSLLSYYVSSYFLIACLFTWIFMLMIFFLSKNDDTKLVQKSSENIQDIINLYQK